MYAREFSASRWTTARRVREGRNSERPCELGEGRCKNKAEKEHKRKWGEVSPGKAQVPPEENAIETISSLQNECAGELLAYKAYDLVMGL